MTAVSDQQISVKDGSSVLARADVHSDPDHGLVRARLHVEAGHLPPGTRSRLVDAILDLPQMHSGARLQASLPLGDCELLSRFRERCTHVTTKAAGASCLLEATITSAAGAVR